MSQAEIVRILHTRHPELSKKQCQRYYYMAIASLEEKDNITRSRKVAFYKARKLRALRDIDPAERKTAQGAMVISKVLDSIAELDGISTRSLTFRGDKDNPIQVDHVHDHFHKHEVIDYSQIPTELLEQLLYFSRGVQNISQLPNTQHE